MAKSFIYEPPSELAQKVFDESGWKREERVCPNCKQTIVYGDNVHWWGDALWHTRPCPTEG